MRMGKYSLGKLFSKTALCLVFLGWAVAGLWANIQGEQSKLSSLSYQKRTAFIFKDKAAIAAIEIPRLDINMLVLPQSRANYEDRYAVWNESSALPGQQGNAVISAYRGFEFLNELAMGDMIGLYRKNGQKQYYSVSNIEVISSSDFAMPRESGISHLVFYTSYKLPQTGLASRIIYIVEAKEIKTSNV
jgi:sortase (surface protein transpeptidase)